MTASQNIRSVLATCIFLWVVNTGYSQTYFITPGDSMIGEVPFNDTYHFIIQLNNMSDEKLVFNWQQINLQIPEGWTAYLCDLGFCYEGFPENGTMDSVYVGEYGLLSVGVNPIEIEGTALIQYSIWEESTPEQIDTLTWIISASALMAINEQEMSELSIFPNPANTFVSIKTNLQNGFDWRITDVLGKEVINGFSIGANYDISIQDIPAGINFISISNKEQIFLTSQLIIIR